LLVEDDLNLGYVTTDNLILKGYDVSWCKNGHEGKIVFSKLPFDLCLIDVMLPKIDGFSLAQFIRSSNTQIPILFLTAKSMMVDKLEGFRIGGDDFIVKPFNMDELVYRIEVFLSRDKKDLPNESGINQIGNYEYDPVRLGLTINQKTRILTSKEGAVLNLLIHHQNRILKREEILNQIWGNDDYFNGRSLDVFISKLRKYLKEDPQIEIINHHSIGFRLIIG
jgi:DNA-binding response OmpR family regulator